MLLWTLECMYLFKLAFLCIYTQNTVAGSYASFIFNFLRNLHIVFQVAVPVFIPGEMKQCRRVPISPYPHQHLLFLVSLITAVLTGRRWYLMVVLIFISLIISDVEHLFTCLLTNCMSSLEKCLFRSAPYFLTRLCVFFDIELYKASYVFWILAPYQMYHLQICSPIQ